MQDNIKKIASQLKNLEINPEEDSFEIFQNYVSKKKKKRITYIYSFVTAAVVLLCIILYGPVKNSRRLMIGDQCFDSSCLCNMSFDKLQDKGYRLKETKVEEDCIDNCNDCKIGKWYFSGKIKGLMLQRSTYESDEIIRVRFTREYRGKVPGMDYVDLKKTQLKDLKWLAESTIWFAEKCSDYITFSNGDVRILLKSKQFNEIGLIDIENSSYSGKTIEAIEILSDCRNSNQFAELYALNKKFKK